MKEQKLFPLSAIRKAFSEYVKKNETFGSRKLSPESFKIFIQASWKNFKSLLKKL